jgi:hypothetical protein
MGIKAGVEHLDVWEAVRRGATGSQRTFDRLGRFLSGQHDPADFAWAEGRNEGRARRTPDPELALIAA